MCPLRQGDERDIVCDGGFQAEAVLAAALGEQRETLLHAAARGTAQRLARERNAAARVRIESEENACEFRAARAHQARKAQHFAAMQGE